MTSSEAADLPKKEASSWRSLCALRVCWQALVRGWWRQIGIETELVQHDASVFFGGDPVDDKEASYRRFFADVQMYASGSGIDPQQGEHPLTAPPGEPTTGNKKSPHTWTSS